MLDMLEVQRLLPCQGQDSAGCSDDDVWAVGLQHLLVLLDADAAEEHCNLDIIQVFRKPLILFMNLEGQLACVAHDKHADLSVHRLDLLEGGKDEHSCLAHSTLGLTDDIHAQDCLRDAFVLD